MTSDLYLFSMLDMLYLFRSVYTFVLADRCHVYERFIYCTLLSERHVVSFISTFNDVHLLMYYISLLLLPPDGFVLCHIGLLVLSLWRFDDDVISPSPGKGRYNWYQSYRIRTPAAWGWTCGSLRMQHKYPCHRSL